MGRKCRVEATQKASETHTHIYTQKDLKPIIQSIVELEGFICATTKNVYMLKLHAFIWFSFMAFRFYRFSLFILSLCCSVHAVGVCVGFLLVTSIKIMDLGGRKSWSKQKLCAKAFQCGKMMPLLFYHLCIWAACERTRTFITHILYLFYHFISKFPLWKVSKCVCSSRRRGFVSSILPPLFN